MMAEVSDEYLLGSMQRVLPFQRDLAECYLQEKGFTFERAAREVRQSFDGAIISTYREVVQAVLKKAGGGLVEIKTKLGKHKSLLSRWRSGEAVPDWETLCLAIAAFDVDLGGSLPRGRDAVIEAIKRTLIVIRQKMFHQPGSPLSRGDLACLHYASLSVAWWNAQKTKKPSHLLAAGESVARHVAAEVPDRRIKGYEDINEAISGWSTYWFVFHYVVPYNWQYAKVATHATNIR